MRSRTAMRSPRVRNTAVPVNAAAAQTAVDEMTPPSHAGAMLRLASHAGNAAENATSRAKGIKKRPTMDRTVRCASLIALRTDNGVMIAIRGIMVAIGIAEGPKRPRSAMARMREMTAAASCPSDHAWKRFVDHPAMANICRKPSNKKAIRRR